MPSSTIRQRGFTIFRPTYRLNDFGSTNQLNNYGTVEKTVGTGGSGVNVNFTNESGRAIVNVQTGTISLGNGGVQQGRHVQRFRQRNA